jgi:hypothetical protein
MPGVTVREPKRSVGFDGWLFWTNADGPSSRPRASGEIPVDLDSRSFAEDKPVNAIRAV